MKPGRLTQPLHPAVAAIFAPAAAFFLGTIVFFLLRGFRLPGGDSVIILSRDWFGMLWDMPIVYYAREPLCHALAHRFFKLTQDLPLAFSCYSALAGGVFLAVLAAYCRRPLFWLALLCSAATWNFAGHIEYYAPFMVALLIFLITLTRALEPEPRALPVHVGVAFGVAYLFHKLTLFFLPSLIWLVLARRGGRWVRRPVPRRQLELALGAFILLLLADVIPAIVINTWGANFDACYMAVNEGLMDLLTPLTPGIARHFEAKSITGMFYVYTFGQPKHFAYFFGFLLAGAPVGLVLVLRHWRKIFETDAARAVATAAACGLIWTFFWQPRGFWKDWDLFCLAGMPLNFLGAGLALGLWRGNEVRQTSTDSLKMTQSLECGSHAAALPSPKPHHFILVAPAGRSSRERPGWEWLAAILFLSLFLIIMCAATVQIHAHRIAPGKSIRNLGDTQVLEREVDDPPPLAEIERLHNVKLDRARTHAVFIYPYQGLSTLWAPERKATLAAADKNLVIISTAVVKW